MSQLSPFTEPDWSQLPPEAVAWAVDEDGMVWCFECHPCLVEGSEMWHNGNPIINCGQFDPTTFNWRDTLRLRPTVAESATVDRRAEIKALTESVEGLKAEQRNYELERLAEEAWKATLANEAYSESADASIAKMAFNAAEAFIAEREKRRSKCP